MDCIISPTFRNARISLLVNLMLNVTSTALISVMWDNESHPSMSFAVVAAEIDRSGLLKTILKISQSLCCMSMSQISIVDVSPSSFPEYLALRIRRILLPLWFLGIESVKMISWGVAIDETRCVTQSLTFNSSCGEGGN